MCPTRLIRGKSVAKFIILSQFQEDDGDRLVFHSETLKSSDRSAQDQGINVMSSCKEN